MKLPRLERLAARVVAASLPTLAASGLLLSGPGCATSRHATYVVPMTAGTCEQACRQASGFGAQGSWVVGEVDDCVSGRFLPASQGPRTPTPEIGAPPEETPEGESVAVCRMVEHYTGGIGRRPPGLRAARLSDADPAARWMANAARLEAASVHAFRRLGRELRDLGAPPALITGAREAARDEIRHARTMARWRDRLGGTPSPVEIDHAPPRGLAELARDNASEGCVAETWGAFVTRAQALRAEDPELRADLGRIAAEELTHAAWSAELHAWLWPQLTAAERAEVAAASREALEGLACPEPTPATRWLGLPDPTAHARMLAVARPALEAELAA